MDTVSSYHHILLTGPTGYIGGSVLTRLLSHSLSDRFRITVLVRTESKISLFRSMGIHAVHGSNADTALLADLAADADIVFACADADDEPAALAILNGLKRRHESTGSVPSLIHTSGTGVLGDDAAGMHPTKTVYSDLDIAHLNTLPPTQPHRAVDLAIVKADKEGYVKTYIVLPSTIYGIASGPLVDAGLQNPRSQQIPQMVKYSLLRGRAGMVGQGKNIWPNVNIDEVAGLYLLIFELVIGHSNNAHHHHQLKKRPAKFEHGAQGFYFAENGEHTLLDVAKAIGKQMVVLGKANDPHPTPFTDAELHSFFPNGTGLGSNSRCKAERSRAIGWKPHKTTKDMLASIKLEFN